MAFNPMRHRIPILKRAIPSLKRRWWRLRHPDGSGIVATQGVRFHLNPDNFVDRQVAFYDDYERAQVDRLAQWIAASCCTAFLDVGAAFGYYSIILAKRFADLKVIAFEPDARNLVQLRDNLDLNGLEDRVRVHAAAAGAHDGTTAFAPGAPSSTGQSRVSPNGEITVAAVTIDGVLEARGQVLAAKIDVEEHELDVLAGMERTLRSNHCLLQIESYRDNVPRVRDYLGSLGYHPDGVIEHDHYFVNAPIQTEARARTEP